VGAAVGAAVGADVGAAVGDAVGLALVAAANAFHTTILLNSDSQQLSLQIKNWILTVYPKIAQFRYNNVRSICQSFFFLRLYS
jgi:hypothetical protein